MHHILFLCVANSARSQMAEALARGQAPDTIRVYSAGSAPSQVNPHTLRVLAEVGIDASSQFSKGIDSIPVAQIDTVVTLCAEETCPILPKEVRRLHWPLPDPAVVAGADYERLRAFRSVRDEITHRLTALFASETSPSPHSGGGP
jgi:arsenate reductase